MPNEKASTVLIADDHAIFRKTIQIILNNMPCVKVVGEAENGKAAIDKVNELNPDMVIMDVHMPVMDGIEATRQITGTHRETIVIALSNDTDDYHKQEMMTAGATAYLSKSIDLKSLEKIIKISFASCHR